MPLSVNRQMIVEGDAPNTVQFLEYVVMSVDLLSDVGWLERHVTEEVEVCPPRSSDCRTLLETRYTPLVQQGEVSQEEWSPLASPT